MLTFLACLLSALAAANPPGLDIKQKALDPYYDQWKDRWKLPLRGQEIKVAIVNNPQMEQTVELTPEYFTQPSGIKVEFTVLSENELRGTVYAQLREGTSEYDVVMIGPYNAAPLGVASKLHDLSRLATNAESFADYDIDDLLPPVRDALSNDGRLYAAPFYGESSFVIYRKDVFNRHINPMLFMPDKPTWRQVKELATRIDSPEMAGLCVRGKEGWGELGASLTTVLNTMGATWWLANHDGSIGEAQVAKPAFAHALRFYKSLIELGGADAATASYLTCLQLYKEGKVSIWYDATAAAGVLESEGSPVKGLNGYAMAPTELTRSSGWLWSWALAIPTSTDKVEAAWQFTAWATSKQYIELVGKVKGWAAVPPGSRLSTYKNPKYMNASAAFAPKTLDSILAAPLEHPGTKPRPGYPAVQYVGVPPFPEVGNECTALFSRLFSGEVGEVEALHKCNAAAAKYSTAGSWRAWARRHFTAVYVDDP